jgi:hypothetical protein
MAAMVSVGGVAALAGVAGGLVGLGVLAVPVG